MVKTLPITEARDQLPTLVDKADRLLDEYVITVKGKPKAVIVSAAEYDSWKETNEILADKELMKSIKQAEKEATEGKTIPWEEFKKQMGW